MVAVVLAAGGIWYYEVHKAAVSPAPVGVVSATAMATPSQDQTSTTPSSTTPVISVASAIKYTDTAFGFSFWYPDGWTVESVPVKDPGQYAGGSIIKELEVSASASSADPGAGPIDLMEYYSASDTITFPGAGCATVTCYNFRAPTRLYFDLADRTWMSEYTEGEPTSRGDVFPADVPTPVDVSNNTMGGLHIITALTAYDEYGVVPLSAQKLLVIGVPTQEDTVSQDGLVKTIMATDPAVATPVSQEEQSSTIAAEIEYLNNLAN